MEVICDGIEFGSGRKLILPLAGCFHEFLSDIPLDLFDHHFLNAYLLLVACWLLKTLPSASEPAAVNTLSLKSRPHPCSFLGCGVEFKVAPYCLSPRWPISDPREKLTHPSPTVLFVEELFTPKVVFFLSAPLPWATLSLAFLIILMPQTLG